MNGRVVAVMARAGVIRVVRVTSGQQVAAGSVVVELDAAEARDAESAGRPVEPAPASSGGGASPSGDQTGRAR